MSTKVVAVLFLAPALFVALLLSADYAVVDVREGGPDGHRFIIPVPLALAQVAISFAPSEAQYVSVPELAPYIADIRRAIDELRQARDGLLVSVEERDESVLIRKVGDELKIDVQESDEEVHVTIPLDAVIVALRQYDGEGFRTRDLLRAIRSIHGDLVHVRDGDEEVRVWIW